MWMLAIAAALAAPVTLQVNDALVKDRPVEGAAVRAAAEGQEPVVLGVTDATGRLVVDLAPGTWLLSYAKAGYVPIPNSPTVISAEGGAITATLSPLLESTGDAGHRRVQIVLNWGSSWSDIPDADAHLVCGVDQFEVYFGERDHVAGTHEARLDVDDIDWGGPETITLLDPPPGRYSYFVRNFTGAPYALGTSSAVVRVVVDDTPAGEFQPPTDLDAQDWRPFSALVVEPDGTIHVEPFTLEQLVAGLDRQSAWGFESGLSCGNITIAAVILPTFGGVLALLLLFLRNRRR